MSVRPSDLGLTIATYDMPQLPFNRGHVELWGIPADRNGAAPVSGPPKRAAFLTMPTKCGPMDFVFRTREWAVGAPWLSEAAESEPFTDCESLPFEPSLGLQLTSSKPDSPTGARIDLNLGEHNGPDERGSANLKDVRIDLPPGLTVSPGGVEGRQVCADEQFGLGQEAPVSCPFQSRVGAVEVSTSQLSANLRGSIFLGRERPGERFRLFVAASAPGIEYKAMAKLTADPQTGQLSTTLEDLPRVFRQPDLAAVRRRPARTARHAALLRPGDEPRALYALLGRGGRRVLGHRQHRIALCGRTAVLAWLDRRQHGPHRRGQHLLRAHPQSHRRGAAAGEVLDDAAPRPQRQAHRGHALSRGYRGGRALHRCEQDRHGCRRGGFGPESRQGPRRGLRNRVLQRRPLRPLDRVQGGDRSLRPRHAERAATLAVDPQTGQFTIEHVLPAVFEGVPLRFRTIGIDLTRPGFLVNPTSCEPKQLTSTITSTNGRPANVSDPFQVEGCDALGFRPKFSVALNQRGRRADNPELSFVVKVPKGQANLQRLKVKFPRVLKFHNAGLKEVCARAAAVEDRCRPKAQVGTAVGELAAADGATARTCVRRPAQRRGLPGPLEQRRGHGCEAAVEE